MNVKDRDARWKAGLFLRLHLQIEIEKRQARPPSEPTDRELRLLKQFRDWVDHHQMRDIAKAYAVEVPE